MIAFLLSLLLTFQQAVAGPVRIAGPVAVGGPANTYVAPSYVNTVYHNETSSSGPNVVTNTGGSSGSLTLLAGDFVTIWCRNGGSSVADAGSDSLGNSYAQLSLQNRASLGSSQMSYSFITVPGTTTFTCTPASNQNFQSILARQYRGGSLALLDVESSNNAATATSFTSASFSTATKGLIVVCGNVGSNSPTWTAGSIGGTTGTNLTTSGVTLQGDTGCEDRITNAAQSGITAAMSWNTTQVNAWTVGAFK